MRRIIRNKEASRGEQIDNEEFSLARACAGTIDPHGVLSRGCFSDLAELSPNLSVDFDLSFTLSQKLEDLHYYIQGKQHIESGYPRVWEIWLALSKEFEDYNENLEARMAR